MNSSLNERSVNQNFRSVARTTCSVVAFSCQRHATLFLLATVLNFSRTVHHSSQTVRNLTERGSRLQGSSCHLLQRGQSSPAEGSAISTRGVNHLQRCRFSSGALQSANSGRAFQIRRKEDPNPSE